MAVELTALIKSGGAGRACGSSTQIFGYGQFMAAGTTQNRFLGKPFLGPDLMPATSRFRMAGMAREPGSTAEKLDGNPVGRAVVVPAPRFFINDRTMYKMTVDVHG